MKTLASIPIAEIESIPLLIKDFLNGNLQGYDEVLFNFKTIENQIRKKSESFTIEQRKTLTEVLSMQYQNIELSEKQKVNLEALESENTFTVTTGHQLNLFTGPVFFIYKILQTVKTAEYLSEKFPKIHIVPVFWMASEDHDFDEIDHFQTEKNLYRISGKQGGAVGNIKIEDIGFISDFENEFKNLPFGQELIELIKTAYQVGKTHTEAVRYLVQHLFSDTGLLALDGDSPLLKKQISNVFEEEIFNESLLKTTAKTVSFLEKEYRKVQVSPRPINLFYLSETRNRIERKNNGFSVVDTSLFFSESEIREELRLHPERFSPNAVMRPVFQETILPNLIYIGGNAEIMYWLELKDYFNHLHLPYPILMPRNSMLFLNSKTVGKIKKMNWMISDVFKKSKALIDEKVLENSSLTDIISEKENILKQQFDGLKKAAQNTDITFANLVNAEETRQLKSFERMRKRLLKAERIKNKETVERVQKLYEIIHPREIWQERVLNFSVFYSVYGQEWLKTCYEQQEVSQPQMQVVEV